MAKGGVTTLVTASHDLHDDDLDRISGGPPLANNVIKVQCEHTREVVDLNDNLGVGVGIELESGSDEMGSAKGRSGSTEDLCGCP
jgi:hypothetical protein